MGSTWEVWEWVPSQVEMGYSWTRLHAGEDPDAARMAFDAAMAGGATHLKIEWRAA